MLQNSVKDEDIKYAENILLGENKKFDKTGRRYLKTFESLDLNAVPGSGKTTLLLAKLLIMHKKLPLENNRGILVISHTNVVIDEIKSILLKNAPDLLRYPHFVGTIQKFTNKYLAIPYYKKTYNKEIITISKSAYDHLSSKYFNSLSYEDKKLIGYNGKSNIINNIRLDMHGDLILSSNNREENSILKNKEKYEIIHKIKKKLLRDGILNYDDAYTLANRYLNETELIIEILQKRFKYVFVDEMQDMNNIQNNILQKIFYEKGKSDSIYQRLGDRNQAIYLTIGRENNNLWEPRENSITIDKSYRLSEKTSKVVSRFAVEQGELKGKNKDFNIKPILLIYEENKKECAIIKEFINIIKERLDFNRIKNSTVKIISNRVRSKDNTNLVSLDNICSRVNTAPKITENKVELTNINYNTSYDFICKYLEQLLLFNNIKIDDEIINQKDIREVIIGSENKSLTMYKICKSMVENEIEERSFKGNCKKLLKGYIENDYKISFLPIYFSKEGKDEECKKCSIKNKLISAESVHGVKGETHLATLFIEGIYSNRFPSHYIHPLIKNRISPKEFLKNLEKYDENTIKQTKYYMRLIYVGLSRATHISGYAMTKKQYNKLGLENEDLDLWEVINIAD